MKEIAEPHPETSKITEMSLFFLGKSEDIYIKQTCHAVCFNGRCHWGGSIMEKVLHTFSPLIYFMHAQFCQAFLNIQEFKRHMLISVHCASWTFTNGEEELII